VGISRQRSSFYKAEQVKYRGTRPQFPLPFLSLAFIHTSLSRMGSDQAAGKRAGGVHYGNRERSRSIYTSRTHSQASLMVLHYTTLVPPLRLCIGPAREAGLSTGTWRGTCHLVKKERKNGLSSKSTRSSRHQITRKYTSSTVSTFIITMRLLPLISFLHFLQSIFNLNISLNDDSKLVAYVLAFNKFFEFS